MEATNIIKPGLDPYRLPTAARPVRYDVSLRPALEESSFSGEVTIQLDIERWSDELVLNAIELNILGCQVDGDDAEWQLDEATERLWVRPALSLAEGPCTLKIQFDGILNDKLRGFYRSTYVDNDGTERIIATTQMQATDCRRAFPCWDEPEYKAVFGVTLDIAGDLTAISNGPEAERSTAEGRHVIRFADTMVMSTYLVAFVVGQLEATDPVDVDGTPLRVVHVPGKEHLTEFGLEVGAFCLRWFQTYYGIPYPSDKVDLVALPDFAAGAMENLGCITFRESLLLVDPVTSTQNEQQLVTDVVAHELAHMWFGDLVTMRWWNGIWLNEAFATFMEVAACEAYRPDWERWTSFGVERTVAFETDSLASTRPVEFEVRSPDDCDGMFDVLTYQKGGALLRMLEQYLGEDRFREGVGQYLRTHSYSNTETNDLWDAIEISSGDPVRRMMDSWIWQPGYPLVSATLTSAGAAVALEQRRFRFDESLSAGDDSATWVIPIHIRNGGTTTTVLLDTDHTTDPIPLTDPDDPVVINAGGHGFFRVAYDDDLRERLDSSALASLSTLERYNLVDDAWSSTIAGRLSASELLFFLEGFREERNHTVWQAIVVALRGLGRLVDDAAFEAFQKRVRALATPTFEALGAPVKDEPDLTGKLRGLLTVTLGCLGGDVGVQARCREIFERANDDPASVDPELGAAATKVVASSGDVATYEAMVDGFRKPSTPQKQLRHLYSLADFDDEALVLRTCEYAMSDAVKSQNAPFLIRLAIGNRNHGAAAWNFMRDHWDEANTRLPANTIVRMVETVSLLDTPALVDEVASFFADNPIDQAVKTLEQILERQRVNAALREREGQKFANDLTQ
jgi:puromycin-sensitive aminopeptidase